MLLHALLQKLYYFTYYNKSAFLIGSIYFFFFSFIYNFDILSFVEIARAVLRIVQQW